MPLFESVKQDHSAYYPFILCRGEVLIIKMDGVVHVINQMPALLIRDG
jgi:hypothetical protein